MTLNDLFQAPRYWGKLPESKSSGAYKHCFQYLIGYTIPGIPYDWSTLTVYFNTYANHLPSCEQILQTCRACETLLHRTFRRFDIWNFVTRNGFSRSGRIWVFEKMVTGCPPSFFQPFFAHSLFYCLLAFFLVRTDQRGIRTRARLCNNPPPPPGGNLYCVGLPVETEGCTVRDCPSKPRCTVIYRFTQG